MSDYAQIPTNLICRFGELSKTEIRVVCYLYASRNRKTGRCDPSRATIARKIGEHRSHISPVIKSLEEKGWIVEEQDGNFVLVSDPGNVTDSVTNDAPESYGIRNSDVTESVTLAAGNVTESVTGVTDSVTGCYENGNSHLKESSEQRFEQRNEQRGMPPAQPNGIESVAVELLVKQTESALKTDLDLETRRRLAVAIPAALVTLWCSYVANRAVGLSKNATRDGKLVKLGYWLTDFRKDHKAEYEKLAKTEQRLPTPAEKAAEIERNRQQPRPSPAEFLRGVQAKGRTDTNAIEAH